MLASQVVLASESATGSPIEFFSATSLQPTPTNLTSLGEACGDRASVDRVIDKFTGDMDAVILQLPGLPDSARELGLEATSQIRELDASRRPELCAELHSSTELHTSLARTLDLQQSDQMAGADCPTIEAVLVLGALKEAVDQLTIVLDATCEATACPPPFTPPICPIACGFPTATAILSAIFDSSISIGDKCGLDDHESSMAAARGEVAFNLGKLAGDIDNSKSASNSILDGAARQDDLEDLRDSVVSGFDGGGFRAEGPSAADEGLNPLLTSLGAAVQVQAQDQASYESKALRALIESRLASGSGLARMQLPSSAGGFLETVRETVALRLQSVGAAGGDTGPALLSFRAGNDALNEARYHDAFLAFQQAYLLLLPGTAPGAGGKEPSL